MMRGTHGVIASAYSVSGDPHFADVTALLHFDGSDGSTTFTDEIGNTWTASGDAQIDTAQSKFGGASGLFDGNGDYITTSYTTSDFDWWVGDYTIECWIRASSYSGWGNSGGTKIPYLIGNMEPTTGTNYWSFGVSDSGRVTFYYFNGSTNVAGNTGTAATTDAWNHIAMTTDGINIFLFLNGSLESTTAISGTPQSAGATPLTIGAGNTGSNQFYIDGWVDDLRITKGTQRYTGSYTVPTKAFPDS